jgi:spermidine synthase
MQRKLLLALFFLSGISALIYEVCWVRQATLTFGVSIYAYSAVLTAYMGGMAIGGYLIGRRADRSAHPLSLFAWLQVGLAVLGTATPFALGGLTALYAAGVQALTPSPALLTALRLGMSLLALAPPAICIGATLPVMSRAVARRDGQVGQAVGQLYAANTLGSVLGCALTAIFFIRLLGLRETIFLAAGINLAVAGLAWWLAGRGAETQLEPAPIPARPPRKRMPTRPTGPSWPPGRGARAGEHGVAPALSPAALRFVLWAYALSGFVALGYEVVWARIISLHTVGAIYSFSIMLTVFLGGLLVGSLIGTWWVQRRRATIFHFGSLELGIGGLAILALFAFAQLPRVRLEDFFPVYSVGAEMAVEGLLSFVTLFPVTILIGAAFPVVTSLYTAEQSAQVGLKMAYVTALNTAGSILGSLLAGFVMVPALGLRNSALVLATLNLGIGMAAVWVYGPARRSYQWAASSVLPAMLVTAFMLPPPMYLGYWQDAAPYLIFYKEGVETTVAVFNASADNPKFSSVNGRVEVPTDVLSMRAFYLLGHLPPILRPDARNALMLSFGNGIASGALASHQIPSIDVVELSPEMVEAAQMYGQENRDVLHYPGLHVHVEDARNFLLQTNQRYDIITTDATHPSNSSSWTLFTAEFYRQVKQHMAAGGVFLQWVPLHSMAIADYQSILRTFQSVFPNATLWYTGGSHTLLLASPDGLTDAALDRALQSAADNPALRQDLGSPQQISRYWIMTSEQLREFAGQGGLVEDNNAFFLPINAEMDQLIQIIQAAAMRAQH